VIAELAEITETEVKNLNPELRRWCTPPNVSSYLLKVPRGKREEFLKAYEALDKDNLVNWHRHIVSEGENLGYLAQKYGVPIRAIKSTNNLRGNLIRIGQSLIVPVPGSSKGAAIKEPTRRKNRATAYPKQTKSFVYTVEEGAKLYDIAKKFGLSVSGLMQANNLNYRSVIMPGQKLKIQSVNAPASHDAGKGGPEGKYHIYRVRAGDNLTVISNKLNVDIKDLMNWNSMTSTNLKIGQTLKYRTQRVTGDAPFYYIVKPRDNLWDLSKKFNTTMEEIKKLNEHLPETLKPGMKIRIR
jgi:membrane-bound lytic murein transglycosylase D